MNSRTQTYPATAANSLLDQIGNTPLLSVRGLQEGVPARVKIYAKAEWYNPGGSVKDRAAMNIITEGIRSGALNHDKVIIDATSGNTGIAYAMIGASLGYRVALALPANAGEERKRILADFGADVILTDPLEGTDGAQQQVRRLVAKHPERYFYADQYNNPANWQAHYRTTAPEIYSQTSGKITHFIAGLGTTGTFVGTSRRLKELNPAIRCIAVQPDSPLHGLEGLKHLASAVVPGIFDRTLVDETVEVSTDEAYQMVRTMTKSEGLFPGFSGAAALAASIRIARTLEEGVIVTVLPDHGTRYLSEMGRDV